ncbi:MAG: potassium channel family protein [Deltaproteobacteria bacterium]|nr:potassium channel family protein [Deltaproteobacteria bacterium]
MILVAVIAMVCAFFTWPEIPAVLAVLVYPFLVYHIANDAGDRFDYRGALVTTFYILMWLILVFAVIYWRNGLVVSGSYREISFFESMYFSVTTWTTLGYGDMSPPDRIKHITSIEALLGYMGTGIWVAIAGLWISQRAQNRQEIHNHNRGLIRKKAESQNDDGV